MVPLGLFALSVVAADVTKATPPNWICWLVFTAGGIVLISSEVCRFLASRFEPEKKRRIVQGLCLRCAYDLRATPGRCPECGMVVTSQKTKTG